MENQCVHDQASSVENVTVGGRMREYLAEKEVDRLIEAAKQNRWGHRDATAILIAYRHGLRASELVALRWSDIELQTGRLHVRRAKGGTPSVHPVSARESRALRRLQRESPASRYVFIAERGAPLSVAGYQRMVARTGEAAGFGFFAAWIGLVPRQNSTGGKERLGSISKQGDRYLRRLLVVAATSVINCARARP